MQDKKDGNEKEEGRGIRTHAVKKTRALLWSFLQ